MRRHGVYSRRAARLLVVDATTGDVLLVQCIVAQRDGGHARRSRPRPSWCSRKTWPDDSANRHAGLVVTDHVFLWTFLQSGDAWPAVSSVESSPASSDRVGSSTTTSSWPFSTSVRRIRVTRWCCRDAM